MADTPEGTVGGLHNAPPALAKAIRIIDGISILSGKAVGWMILPMVFSLVYEVFARYLFNAPTIWASDPSGAFCLAVSWISSATRRSVNSARMAPAP